MQYHAFVIKYAEIGVKGKNRYIFEDALVKQLKEYWLSAMAALIFLRLQAVSILKLKALILMRPYHSSRLYLV